MGSQLSVYKNGFDSVLSHRALLYLQELAEELSSALPASVSCPKSPKVSSPTKPKKSQLQTICQGGEENTATQDEDFVLQVEAEEGEESEAPSESSSDPEPVAPRSNPRGSTSGVT